MSRFDFDNSNMYGHINTEVNHTELIDNVNNHSATTPHSRDDERNIYDEIRDMIDEIRRIHQWEAEDTYRSLITHDYELYTYETLPYEIAASDTWMDEIEYFVKYRKYIGKLFPNTNYKPKPMNIPIRNIEHSNFSPPKLFKKTKTNNPKIKRIYDEEELRKLIQMLKQHQRDFNINDNFQPYKSTAEAYSLADRFRNYPYNIGLIE